jgi:hypothetical protein
VSDVRPPGDGPSWPEHDLEPRSEEPAQGWSDDPDNPYRYEPRRYRPSYPAEHPFADENPFPDDQAEGQDEIEQPAVEYHAKPPEQPREEPPFPVAEEQEAEQDAEPYVEPEPARVDPITETGEPVMAFEASANAWNPKRDGNRRRPTTAEQAVPWLIGLILALTGVVIVLLALIFSSPDGLVAGEPTATATPSASVVSSANPSTQRSDAEESPSAKASASAEPTPNPTTAPAPSYGPLEMVYLGRPSGVAPIYLLRRDFSKKKDAEVMAQADQGVEKFAWSPDGRVGAAIISGRAVALTPGRDPRRLADNVSALTFGWDAETLYAVRITRDGARDRAQVLQIDFVSGASDVIASVTYRRPVIGAEVPLREAQFIDDGGVVRIYAVADGNLAMWILGAPSTYRIDPGNGDTREIGRQPVMWSPDGTRRVTLHEGNGRTDIRLRDRSNKVISAVSVSGLVSHVRWAGTSNEIVFTLGVLSASGGVRQDLYVWDLRNRKDPAPLTSNGASFGAEWRGVMSNWAP